MYLPIAVPIQVKQNVRMLYRKKTLDKTLMEIMPFLLNKINAPQKMQIQLHSY